MDCKIKKVEKKKLNRIKWNGKNNIPKQGANIPSEIYCRRQMHNKICTLNKAVH